MMAMCLWCMKDEVIVSEILQRYATGGLTPEEMKEADEDLTYCSDCVVAYHKARDRAPTLHKRLWELETSRLLQVFQEMYEGMEEEDLLLVEDDQEQPWVSRDEFYERLKCSLMEVLRYPYLLCHRGLCDMVVKALCTLEEMQNSLEVKDKLQGIYLLMVHPNETVRRFAICTAKSLGRVDRDNFYELKEVFFCMFLVIELGISLDFQEMDNSYYSGKLRMLPPYLYDSKNEKNYWLGICMLLSQLNPQAMDSLFTCSENHSNIPQCILNTMAENREGGNVVSDPFWPALQCFMAILKCLGSKVWGQVEPEKAFGVITRAASYVAEIKNIRLKTKGMKVKEESDDENDDNLVSCSQIVYSAEGANGLSDWSSNYRKNDNDIFEEMGSLVSDLQSEIGQDVHSSTFLWFIRFVRSVMDLGEKGIAYVVEVLHYLCSEMDKEVLSGHTLNCDKVTEFFFRILFDIIEELLRNNCMKTLYHRAHTWVQVIVQCSTLGKTCSNRFGVVNKKPATGIGTMSRPCMDLICSLLKQGGRIGTVPESTSFLNILNSHKRRSPHTAWDLNESQSKKLQDCLTRVVKAIMDKTAASATVLSAPPTPPADTVDNVISHLNSTLTDPLYRDVAAGPSGIVNFVKDEPLSSYWHYQDDFWDDPKDLIKAKKEPSSPVHIPEFQPALDLKPDFGKLQEIRGRLNNSDNLSKIQAIAKGRPDGVQQNQNGYRGLKENGQESPLHGDETTSAFTMSKMKWNDEDEDDDEPLDVRRDRLKKSLKSPSEIKTESDNARTTVVQASDYIIISDDEASTDGGMLNDSSSGSAAKRLTCEPPTSDAESIQSPGRDYDWNLSDSQVFEFETQDYIASAWNDSRFNQPVETDKPKSNATSKASTSCKSVEPSSRWVDETQPVSDDDIEKACQQVEEQICKQQQEQSAPAPSTPVPPKSSVSSEKWDNFIQPKSVPPRSPTKKPNLASKKSQHSSSILVIEPLVQKVRKRSRLGGLEEAQRTVSAEEVQRTVAAEKPTSFMRPPPTPAIVPPKKVRKLAEPESVAERMGLKKKERKAFDLSQRSLDTLGELRSHGQNVHVEQLQKPKRVVRKTKPQPKLAGKGGKKLLASQDMQYFRQSRQKSTPATTAQPKPMRSPVPETVPKTKWAVDHREQPKEDEEEDDDDYQSFLPCSQPDPAQRTDKAKRSKMTKDGVKKSKKERRVSCNDKYKESSRCQSNKDINGNNSTAENMGNERDKDGVEEYDDWWLQTQNEPTDMELCSQMDQMEYDPTYLNTQREPVDMDIDMDDQSSTSAGGTDLQARPSPASVVQKASPIAPTQDSVKDDRLKKSGMSTASLKKAKPSTTKIYAGISRSASLVEEMEKAPKPQPAAHTSKAKGIRPPPNLPLKVPLPNPSLHLKGGPQTPPLPKGVYQPLLKTVTLQPPPPKAVPQPDLRQPPSFSRSSYPPNQAPKSVVPNKAAFHPPTYKTYSRPEDPINMPRVTVNQLQRNDQSSSPQRYDPSFLVQAILKWEYHMFKDSTSFGTPVDLCPFPLKEVPTMFSNYKEYFGTMYPLLLINAFDELVGEWLRSTGVELHLKVQGIEYLNHTASANFTVTLNPEQEKRQLYPKEDDLVLLWLPENSRAYDRDEFDIHDQREHFGYVSRSFVISNGGGQPSTLNLTIQTRGNVSSVNTQPVRCRVIGSLISTLREFRALCSLQSGIMANPKILLSPNVSFFTPGQQDVDMPEYNDDQVKAIGCGVAMVKRQERKPKILLIHGPPGTGKSKTIVGLLHRLFSDHSDIAPVNHHNKLRRTRVLLCAPSNAAIDSLMKKIIPSFKEVLRKKEHPQGNCGDINLVRLGSEKTISQELLAFSLDRQTAKKTLRSVDPNLHKQKEKLDQEIERLSRMCAITDKQSSEFKQLVQMKQHCLSERERLGRQLKEVRTQKQKVQTDILQEAHVICCTLSTSGSSVLESAFRRLGHDPFSCVIIDEAGQAKETETLIPLLYRCPSLILVGDPEQLPPTVVSQKAKELRYDQSLMARLWKSLHQSNLHPLPIVFLSYQYRMHPDICEFPSKYIYSKKLKSNCETAQKRCAITWLFEPYRVFDVTDGSERKQENDSYYNLKEIKLVQLLLRKMNMSVEKQVRVGVITPYNAQKQRIRNAVTKETNNKLQVEVDTVDGFQGREMDCIIVSCVRASGEMGSIGFVGNRQRMNVTITRAKYSLFILGHLRTLREQRDWGALIKDAMDRGIIIKTQERDFQEASTKILKSRLHSNLTSPASPTHIPLIPIEIPGIPVQATGHHFDLNGGRSPTVSSTTSGPSIQPDRPRDPRLSARPTDPRLSEPIREHPRLHEPIREHPRFPEPVREHPRLHEPVREHPRFPEPIREHPRFPEPIREHPRLHEPIRERPHVPGPIREHRPDREKQNPVDPRHHPHARRIDRDSYRRSSAPQPHSSSSHSSRQPERRTREYHRSSSSSPHERYKR